MNTLILGAKVKLTQDQIKQRVVDMRRSDQIAEFTYGRSELGLLELLAVEHYTKNRTFVIERLYIKYKQMREKREKIELLEVVTPIV